MTSTEITLRQERETSNFLFQQAKVLSNTEIVPAHLRGKPDHIYAIILTGHEIGIAPSTALQSFASINGKLTMSAELMRALILGAGHSLSFPESSTTSCTIIGKRKETGDTATVTYTKEDAERAGLWTSHTWKKYPRQLLSARATTELARLLFPDIIKGVSYTPEEIGGEFIEDQDKPTFEVQNAHVNDEPIESQDVRATPTMIAEQEKLQNMLDEGFESPIQQIEEIIEETFEQSDDLITEKQLKYLATLTGKLPEELKQVEIEAREKKYPGRSRKDFTKEEATAHIDFVKQLTELTEAGQ